jgi:hypothetical protein
MLKQVVMLSLKRCLEKLLGATMINASNSPDTPGRTPTVLGKLVKVLPLKATTKLNEVLLTGCQMTQPEGLFMNSSAWLI